MAIHTCFSLIPSCFSSPKLEFPKNSIFQSPREIWSKLSFNSDMKRSFVGVRFQNGNVPCVGEDLPIEYADWLPKRDPSDRRRAGILLHPTSFPGPYGIGDLGPQAFQFLDWLHLAGCSMWQVLPLVPPGKRGNEDGSPYSGQDANCGNTLLISLEELVDDGLLKKEELPEPLPVDRINYSTVAEIKDPLIAKAAKRLLSSEGKLKEQLENFRRDPNISSWLEDAAYFAAIDNSLNTISWYDWPEPLKNRHLAALEEVYQSEKDFIDTFIAQQFLFQRQWQKVRDYARSKGISIMGDMPIYVGYHSADVWANKKHFLLNRKGFPLIVSGVPPDAFSETGQLWGRLTCNLISVGNSCNFYHPYAEAKVAMLGRWKVGPGKPLFDAIFQAVGKINIIAEDLGVITEDVVQLRKSIEAPGMAVLQFGFGSDAENPHLPHNHEQNQVVYTGTHDNDTTRGWWNILPQEEKSNVLKYLSNIEEEEISWRLIEAAVSSVARIAIIPMQDVLGLGSESRMNIPATQFGNWSWRIPSSTSFDSLDAEAKKLRDILATYGRL
ncbi:PREDICTED: 4-alpha-glucanotransferase, chloroplastic/amyloplastic isoform X2 [Nicotiana attenuata]|uniref:4-alpha-glucanotransferase, chloroplastic/amyloplastic isoform X2 n=1 Tax=Nicotiana attenuata TaxID=49451 RepID=UPI000904F10D|nr:PREDICTED: 4-alpha-glucanotransferase, chloroplastic/amyloplastic isoform X2 [Nicotiana attenuata]